MESVSFGVDYCVYNYISVIIMLWVLMYIRGYRL